MDGLAQPDGRVWGCYIHGVFDNDQFRRGFLHDLEQRSGRTNRLSATPFSYRQWKEEQYDRLAEHVRKHCDVERIYRLVGLL
jgi:adenosylcobyric acid synthase